MIDDRDIEALPLSADINTGPRSHASKHARLQYRPHAKRMQALKVRGCHARHHPTAGRSNKQRGSAQAVPAANYGSTGLRMARLAACASCRPVRTTQITRFGRKQAVRPAAQAGRPHRR
jgi:hypothetical protein